MIEAMMWVGATLLQRSAAGSDTLLMKQVPSEPNVFERVTGIASGLLTIAILVFVVAAVPAAWNFRKSYKKVNQLLERIYGDVNPIMRHASIVADNVDYITTALRTDVQKISATIATANTRLQQAVTVTEQRLNDISALLQVVQQEAEDAFVSTASAMRGVRTGASALARQDSGPIFATSEEDVDEVGFGAEEQTEEASDGFDSDTPPAEDDAARPRLRRRGRTRAVGRAPRST
jgi:uncharacterized protein YoxC